MPPSHSELIAKIAGDFEAAWLGGQSPSIREWLQNAPVEVHDDLIRELVVIDAAYRLQEQPDLDVSFYEPLGPLAVAAARDLIYASAGKGDLTVRSVRTVLRTPEKVEDTAGSISPRDTTVRDQGDAPPLLTPGSTFGRYRILEKLGGGGMGNVYKAEDTVLERRVAIKIPHGAFALRREADDTLQRFQRESKAMALLNHPNLCPVFDAGCIDGIHFLTMALIDGQPLDFYLEDNSPLAITAGLQICRKIALALERAHQADIIHRDLKPANIMLTSDGEPVVIDFGLARRPVAEQTDCKTQAGQIVGTFAYMSPEQARGASESLTPATDVFSLGVIAFCILTGRKPFEGVGISVLSRILTDDAPLPSSIRSSLTPEIDSLLLKMLAKDPGERYQSMRNVENAMATIEQLPSDRASLQRQRRTTISPGCTSDIFLSFSPADDEATPGSSSGWVSKLIQDLEWRLCQLHGNTDEITVAYSHDPLHEASEERPRYLDSKIVLIVNSPGYTNSIWSLPQLQSLRDAAQQKLDAGELIVVEMDRALDESKTDHVLAAVSPIRFWNQSPDGSYEILRGDADRGTRYFGKVDDLARKLIAQLHKSAEVASRPADQHAASVNATTNANVTAKVFLAEVTDDLDPVREEVRRYLEQLTVQVYPTNWFRRERDEFVNGVRHDLDQADLFVQLLGPVVGKRPPASDDSYARLQYDCAKAAGKRVLQWRSTSVAEDSISDPSHQGLVFGPQVQCSTIQEFERELERIIEAMERENSPETEQPGLDAFVFIDVDQQDAMAAKHLCDIFDEAGLSYAMPLHEGPPHEIRQDLEANMMDCDGLIIYYGQVSGQWVREQLRMWRRTLHKRERPLQALAVYEGPPDEKTPLGMRLPGMDLLNCRDGLDKNTVLSFLNRLGE